MESITLGQIVSAIGMLSVIFGVGMKIHKLVDKAQEDRIKLNETLKELHEKIDNFEYKQMKSALVNYLCLAETMVLTEEQKKNAHELYDEYTSKGHNSYVHDKFERLVKEGKL